MPRGARWYAKSITNHARAYQAGLAHFMPFSYTVLVLVVIGAALIWGATLDSQGPNCCRAGRQSRHATISTIAQSLRDVLQSSSPSLRCPRRKARCIPSSVYSRVLSYGGKIITGQFRTFATISANCGLVHRTKTARSFDDFVDERKEAGWEGEVYRFCGLEIDQ